MTKAHPKNKLLLIGLFIIVLLIGVLGGALGHRLLGYRILDKWFPVREKNFLVPLDKEESMVISVVDQVSPAVVTIGYKETQLGFFIFPDTGSGFIVSGDGLIMTNKHVVSDENAEYKVITKDDQEYKVEKIYRDPVNDLAILQINPGNSGGPLLDSSGKVIGINVAVSVSGQNIGFALPINIVKTSLEEFNSTGQFSRTYLGVSYKIISQDLALLNDLPQGAYVVEVLKDSPAEKAGMKQGDIITKIDGEKILEENGGLAKIVAHKKIGDKISIELWRNGKADKLEITLEEGQ